jgi:hypothetical protein
VSSAPAETPGSLSKEQWRPGSLRVSAAAADPVTVAKRERDAQLRELTDRRTAPTSTSATS